MERISKGARTRRRIVGEALQLFSVRGYYHTGVRDILAATGLTKGGLYGHFSSKEEIWYAVYDEARSVWRSIVYQGAAAIPDPLARIETVAANHLHAYLGREVFAGGCFFVNMLVELSDQSPEMSRHLLGGFVRFARRIMDWLDEARAQGRIRPGDNHREIADFVLIALNGAATLFTASRDPAVLAATDAQLRCYLDGLRI